LQTQTTNFSTNDGGFASSPNGSTGTQTWLY
jgi:hypothetical protein